MDQDVRNIVRQEASILGKKRGGWKIKLEDRFVFIILRRTA